MRRVICATIGLALLATCVSVVQSDEPKDARAILGKAIQAMGGEAKLAKQKAITWKDKGTYYGMGDGQPYTGEFAMQWPGQFYMDIEGVFMIVLNGDKGWVKAGGVVNDLPKEQLDLQLLEQRARIITSLLPLKDKEYQLKLLPDAKVEKGLASVVQVTRKDYPETKLFFSKKTGLLVKSEFRTKAAEQEFKEVNQEAYYGDYRDVDGVKRPHKILVQREGKKFVESETIEMKASEKLDAKVFGRPSAD
jgi:hypothetical protein